MVAVVGKTGIALMGNGWEDFKGGCGDIWEEDEGR